MSSPGAEEPARSAASARSHAAGLEPTAAHWWGRLSIPDRRRPDVLLAGLLTVTTFFVHDVPYVLSAPFWTDESWVAISVRLPLSDLTTVTASTPVGWTLLLRLVVIGGPERLRIVTLLFAALTVAAAYAYVRSLPWPRTWVARIAAVLGGLAALLSPSALTREDLKQYTADGFITLLVLFLVSRAERTGDRRRLVQLGLCVVVAFLFSATSLFAGLAAFTAILLVRVRAREWLPVRRTITIGAITGLLLITIFVVFYAPGQPSGLNDYWASNYLPLSSGGGVAWTFLRNGLNFVNSRLGLGPLAVAVVLVTAGAMTQVRLHRVATGLTLPILLIEMLVLGAARQYPLFDLRTSHFLMIAVTVTAAVGAAGVCCLAARWHPAAGVGAGAIAAALFLWSTWGIAGGHRLPQENVRGAVHTVRAERQPGEPIVVNELSNWAFAYYWPQGRPVIAHVTSNLQGFVTVFPDQSDIIVMRDSTRAGIDAALNQAQAALAGHPGARIWLVREHQHRDEFLGVRAWAKRHHFTVEDRPEPLSVLTPAAG